MQPNVRHEGKTKPTKEAQRCGAPADFGVRPVSISVAVDYRVGSIQRRRQVSTGSVVCNFSTIDRDSSRRPAHSSRAQENSFLKGMKGRDAVTIKLFQSISDFHVHLALITDDPDQSTARLGEAFSSSSNLIKREKSHGTRLYAKRIPAARKKLTRRSDVFPDIKIATNGLPAGCKPFDQCNHRRA